MTLHFLVVLIYNVIVILYGGKYMNKVSRNYGIDLLRIISMLGVVFLHVLGHGGILSLDLSPVNFSMVWFIEILAYPAVNCFVLISGYIGYKEEKIFPKIKNLLNLAFTVAFYSVSLFLIFKFFGPETLGLKELVKSFFPIILKNYWFFTAYVGLFLLSPMLNLLVYKSNFKHAFIYLAVFSLFSIISTVYDSFSLIGGYSVIWFVLIYLLGAIIKKYNFSKLFSKKIWLVVLLSAFIITWISKIILHFSNIPFLVSHSGQLVNYVSPTIVLMAIALLCLSSKIYCRPTFSCIILFFATSAFSVYLIHDNTLVREYLISKIHSFIGDFSFVLLTLSIIGCVVAIFLTCILMDKIRMLIFKLIKIDKLSERIEKFIRKLLNIVYIRLENALNLTAE